MIKHLFSILFSIILAANALAQENDSIQYPNFKFGGVLKSKYEWATDVNTSRFVIRNSRLEIEGDVKPKLHYKAKVELSDEGEFKVLDAYGAYDATENLSLKIGQFSLPLFNSYITDPGTMMFANRAFLGKYFVSSRDIGLMASYKADQLPIPTKLELAVFNGNSANSSKWSSKQSYAGRLTLGKMKGLRSTFKVYDNYRLTDVPDEFQHYLMYGADLRYGKELWKVESEVMIREDKTNDYDLLSAYIQGGYAFALDEKNIVKHIIPAARYDFMDQNKNEGNFDVQRLSLGLGLGLSKLPFHSILRVDYEWYFTNNQLIFFQENEQMDSDKLSVELVFMF